CCCRPIPARSRLRSIAWPAATPIPCAPRNWKTGSTPCCFQIASNRRRRPMSDAARTPPHRPEIHRETEQAKTFGVVEKPLSAWERVYNLGFVRKLALLAVLALAWELYARSIDNSLIFPTFSATARALYEGFVEGGLLLRA